VPIDISPTLGGVAETSVLFVSEIVIPVNVIGYTPLLISGSINTGTFKATLAPDESSSKVNGSQSSSTPLYGTSVAPGFTAESLSSQSAALLEVSPPDQLSIA